MSEYQRCPICEGEGRIPGNGSSVFQPCIAIMLFHLKQGIGLVNSFLKKLRVIQDFMNSKT